MSPVKLFLILGAVAAFTIAVTLGQTNNYLENSEGCRGHSGMKYNNSKGDSCTCITPASGEAVCEKRNNNGSSTTTAGTTNTSSTAGGSTTSSTTARPLPPLPINF